MRTPDPVATDVLRRIPRAAQRPISHTTESPDIRFFRNPYIHIAARARVHLLLRAPEPAYVDLRPARFRDTPFSTSLRKGPARREFRARPTSAAVMLGANTDP